MTDPRLRRILGALLAALMLLPPVVAIVTMWGRHWYPVSDLAIFDMSVRDVFTAHTPLTGLWSRPGWSHPGPVAYWVVALLSKPFGEPAWMTRVGAAFVEGVAIGALAWITWRRGLRMMLAAAAVTGMTYLATGPWIFRQPWNVHVPLPFFLLFLFLVVIVAQGGSSRLLVLMALVGSMIVQTHVGYAALIATGFVWVIGWTVFDARRSGRWPERWRSTVAWTLVLLSIVWLPPVLDSILYPPGNLARIAGYFVPGNHYAHVGLSQAAGIVASEFRAVPPMFGGPDLQTPFLGLARPSALSWLFVPVVMLAAAFLAARAAGRRADLRRVAFAFVLLTVAVIAISRADEPRAYTFQWRVVIAAFAVVVSAWAIADVLTARLRTPVRALAVVTVVALTACGAVIPNVSPISLTRGPPETRERASRELMETVRRRHLADTRTLFVRFVVHSEQLYGGIVDELDRDGVDVRVPANQGRIYGGHRVGSAATADEVWTVTERGSEVPDLLAEPDAHVIASTSPLAPAEEAELARLQDIVGAQLDRAGEHRLLRYLDSDLFPFTVARVPGVDQLAASRIGVLNQIVSKNDGCRCAIVAVPGGRAGRHS